jgi:hypothetical protein
MLIEQGHPMPEISYDNLKNNIDSENADGGTMHVTFKCPVSGLTFEQKVSIKRSNSVGSKVKNEAKREAAWGFRRALADFVSSLLGRNRAGSAARRVAYSATSGAGSGYSYGKAEKRQAVCDAFEKIAKDFEWDEEKKAFIHNGKE